MLLHGWWPDSVQWVLSSILNATILVAVRQGVLVWTEISKEIGNSGEDGDIFITIKAEI